MKKTLLVTFSILFSLVASSDALETDTHELINEYIATHTLNEFSLDLYLTENLEFKKGRDEIFNAKKVWEWLKEGGRYEDKPLGCMPYWRSLRHFHNPLTDEGYGLWESSLQWSQEPAGTQECGHYSWHDVRSYFYTALTSPAKTERDENFAQTFRGLGQLMHLVQDLSVPAHTRDDGHILYNYEIWAKGKDENGNPNVDFASIAPIFFDPFSINAPNPLAAVPVANLFDTNQYVGWNPDITLRSNIGLSEYTNANFFSEDTIFRNFPYPSRDSVSLNDIAIPDPRYPSGDVLRKYFNKMSDGDTGYRVATVSFLRGFEDECAPFCSEWFYENAALDDEVYGDYATRLIPRAVGYSAGLLEYFFRGKFDVELGDGEIKITNKSAETMHDGYFELYYDNENGDRQEIDTYSGAEVASLAPDEDTTITFDPPSDFGEDKHYIIVYRGALGNETDAVVVGFKQEPKALGLSFKLTRGDGLVLDESNPPYYFYVVDHEFNYVETTVPVYDAETEYWSFSIVDPEDADPLGYFVSYTAEDGLTTQYPYRYKYTEKGSAEDLIPIGTYIDIIPYYKIISQGPWVHPQGSLEDDWYKSYINDSTLSYTRRIASSVPVKVSVSFSLIGGWIGAAYGDVVPEGIWGSERYGCTTNVSVKSLNVSRSWGDSNGSSSESVEGFSVAGMDYTCNVTVSADPTMDVYYDDEWVTIDFESVGFDVGSVLYSATWAH